MVEKVLIALFRQRAAQLDLDNIIEDPSRIAELQVPFYEEVRRWGVLVQMVKVYKVEATPKLKSALSLAKKTELDNYVNIKRVSTEKHTNIIKAQGERDKAVREAEGQAYYIVLYAKGHAEQIRNEARAEAAGIKKLAQNGMGNKAVYFVMKNRYMDTLYAVINRAYKIDYYTHDSSTIAAARLMNLPVMLR